MFRSTGSYDLTAPGNPRPFTIRGFDPQALTSLTCNFGKFDYVRIVSIHRLLRALTLFPYIPLFRSRHKFRSTGSYEPRPTFASDVQCNSAGFDPQALTSLTVQLFCLLHWSPGFDPQALTSLTLYPAMTLQPCLFVSIHRLLRA